MGKTTLCGTCPDPLILSAESGLLSLSSRNLPFIEVKTVQDLSNLYDWCARSNEARQFKTIALDSLSEIAEVVLSNAKKQVKDPRQAYGELIEKMRDTIRLFRDLPGFNVYMSAKQGSQTDAASGVVTNGPSMPGAKLAQELPYFFDEVFQLAIGSYQDQTTHEQKTFRYLRTQPDFNSEAKDRSGKLREMEPPDLGAIFKKIAS